jgi:V-type H+-transporting ATPase subunit e
LVIRDAAVFVVVVDMKCDVEAVNKEQALRLSRIAVFSLGDETATPTMSSVRVFMALIATALIGTIAWFLMPKGTQQTYCRACLNSLFVAIDWLYSRSLLRTSVLLTLACCYLMWAITYLAQLHPLIGLSNFCLKGRLPKADPRSRSANTK